MTFESSSSSSLFTKLFLKEMKFRVYGVLAVVGVLNGFAIAGNYMFDESCKRSTNLYQKTVPVLAQLIAESFLAPEMFLWVQLTWFNALQMAQSASQLPMTAQTANAFGYLFNNGRGLMYLNRESRLRKSTSSSPAFRPLIHKCPRYLWRRRCW